jgi:predicted RNA-binding Zn-ribbon protein involved in translation (DUF1610 family)
MGALIVSESPLGEYTSKRCPNCGERTLDLSKRLKLVFVGVSDCPACGLVVISLHFEAVIPLAFLGVLMLASIFLHSALDPRWTLIGSFVVGSLVAAFIALGLPVVGLKAESLSDPES